MLISTTRNASSSAPIKQKSIFLGGTCNGSTWREELIPLLDPSRITYYNPVVSEWTEAHQLIERREREECNVCLYVITPRMVGVYAIAEAVDDSNKRPEKTVFCFLEIDSDGTVVKKSDTQKEEKATNECRFDQRQVASLNAVGTMVECNGGVWVRGGLNELAVYLNAT